MRAPKKLADTDSRTVIVFVSVGSVIVCVEPVRLLQLEADANIVFLLLGRQIDQKTTRQIVQYIYSDAAHRRTLPAYDWRGQNIQLAIGCIYM